MPSTEGLGNTPVHGPERRRPAAPRVSALIPAHNYARFVADAIESVLGQDYPGEIECIVVDDGSTDGTLEVVSAYRDRGVRVFHQENLGQAAALNRAFRSCKGDIICFLDADDVWVPGKVAAVVEAMLADPRIGLVHHAVQTTGPNDEPLPCFTEDGPKASGDVSRQMWRKVLRWMFSPFSTLCLRRPVAELVFPLVTSMRGNADDLIAPCAGLLAPVAYLPERLVRYRVHGDNMWAVQEASRKLGEKVAGLFTPRVGARAHPKDLNQLPEPERYCRVLEEKTKQANLVLERARIPGRLSPWADWTYLKTRGAGDPWRSTLRAVAAAWGLRGLPQWERAALAFRLARRMVKHRTRRARASRGGESQGCGG